MSDKAVVGIMRIIREAEPDPKAPQWVRVRVEPVRKLDRPVTLAEIKAEPKLAKMELIRQSRLSVAPVRDDEWDLVLKMGGGK
jgi:predicted RNA-binding protein with PUA-like domain